ncbi:MAG: DUF3836 domain-containing protein [Bacteroides sp.]|nr:DUF3836 domain-containing protein [Bacteroides sp.]
MKTKLFIRKSLLLGVYVWVFGVLSTGNTNPDLIHTDVVKDNNLYTREIYLSQPNGEKIPLKMYTYIYDNQGQLSGKTTYGWSP